MIFSPSSLLIILCCISGSVPEYEDRSSGRTSIILWMFVTLTSFRYKKHDKIRKRNIDNISFCWPLLSVYNQHFFMRKDQRDHLPVSMSASLVQPALPRAAGATAAASELPAASHGDEASHAAGSCLCQPDHR